MASTETLARLTASAINHSACGGRSSSMESLNSGEIAALLKGLTQEQMIFAQAKYMGDSTAQIALLIYIRQYTADEAKKGKWKVRPSQIAVLAEQAVIEAITKQRTSTEIAKALEVTEGGYRACWKDKFSRVMTVLYDLDAAVRRSVSINS